MKYTLQTLNKEKIDVGYLDNTMEKVRVGDLIIPTDEFLRFAGKLIRNSNPKKIIFGDYEVRTGEFGYLIDKLIHEGSFKEMRRI